MVDLRLAYLDMFNENLRTYSWNATTFVQIGNDKPIAGITLTAMQMIGSKKLAMIDNSNNLLKCFYFDNLDWNQLGFSSIIIGGIGSLGTGSMAMIRPDRLALVGDSMNASPKILHYDFNSEYFSLVGNQLAQAGITAPAICGMDIFRFAYIESNSKNLKYMAWDGTTFVQIGASLNIPSCTLPKICAMSKTRIAFIESVTNQLRVYDFNLTTLTWAQVGSNLTITGAVQISIDALSVDTIALIDDGNDQLRAYYFNGTIFALIGTPIAIAGSSFPNIASFYKPFSVSCYNEIPLTGQGYYPESQ